jgi:hypothetical protein
MESKERLDEVASSVDTSANPRHPRNEQEPAGYCRSHSRTSFVSTAMAGNAYGRFDMAQKLAASADKSLRSCVVHKHRPISRPGDGG